MPFPHTVFKRRFCLPSYNNLQVVLARMSFAKDFITKPHGDPYPLLSHSADWLEEIKNGRYTVKKGEATRLLGQFFPYATYEVAACLSSGSVGFVFTLSGKVASFSLASDGGLLYTLGEHRERLVFSDAPLSEACLLVTCRPGAFDIYKREEEALSLVGTVKEPAFAASHQYAAFGSATAALSLGGGASATRVLSYIDNGIALADIRPIRYENGEVMQSEGKIYLTATVRMEEEAFQGVFSWIPATAELALTGALFYDAGDGLWCGDVAASLLYHRTEKRWLLWVASFAHGHILRHAAFTGEPRFGVNVIDITLMDKAPDGADPTLFLGFEGDEDPDFFYDEKEGRWLFAVCRLDPLCRQYRYFFFASSSPFEGYRFLGKGKEGAETGGSFVRVDGALYFVCGNGYGVRAEYRIYGKEGFSLAAFDYDDGGFRGWGTVLPLSLGSRTRLFLLTFDRQNASGYTWSYGNLYCFEA